MNFNHIYKKINYLFCAQEYYQNNVGKKILFKWLLILSMLQTVFLLLTIYNSRIQFINFVKQIPEVIIEKGKIVSDLPKPYLIKTVKNGIIFIDFDKKASLANASVGSILINRENIEIKAANKITKYKISDLCLKLFKTDNLIVNGKFLISYYNQIKTSLFIFTILIFTPISIILLSLINLIQFSITGLIIWAISKLSSKEEIDLRQIVNLNILAAIPALIIIELIVNKFSFFLSSNALGQIASIVNFAYLYFAFKSNLKTKQKY